VCTNQIVDRQCAIRKQTQFDERGDRHSSIEFMDENNGCCAVHLRKTSIDSGRFDPRARIAPGIYCANLGWKRTRSNRATVAANSTGPDNSEILCTVHGLVLQKFELAE
jgi:hypothetical protein